MIITDNTPLAMMTVGQLKEVIRETKAAEEQMVLMNRFQAIAREAIADINADRRYKMIVNAVSVVDADPTLNISDIVLKRVDELYEAGALE